MVHRHRSGLSLVEILIAAVLIAVIVVTYLSLSARETRWTRDVDDRAKATALARNTLALIEYGYRSYLLKGVPQGDTFVLSDPDQAIPEGNLVLGVALFEWVRDKRLLGGFSYTLTWETAPFDGSGITVDCVGRVDCQVQYRTVRGEARWVRLSRILGR